MKKITNKILNSVSLIIFTIVIILYLPYLKKYDIKLKFNIYRSIMCTYFVVKSLEFLKNENNILENCFKYNSSLEPLIILFSSYIIIDIIYTLLRTNKRFDLLLHHLVVLIIIIIGYKNKLVGNIFPILLLNEAISIVSGFDSVELNCKKFKQSVLFKKIRKYIILFIRLPIWGFMIYQSIKDNKLVSNNTIKVVVLSINIIMIILDFYWFNKCNKFIEKNKN